MRIKPFRTAFAIAAVIVAAGALSSCAWLNGSSIAHSWSGTLVDLYEEGEYPVTLDLAQDGDQVSGSATFTFIEESVYDVVVDGTREEDDTFVVTLYDVSEADVTLTGTVTDFGSTYSGTWDLNVFSNYGTFSFARTD